MSCKILFASAWTCPSCRCSVITRERLVNRKTSSPLGRAPNQLQECTPKSRQTKRRCGGPRSQQACCAACGCLHPISRRIRYRMPERIKMRNAATSVFATFSFTPQGCDLVKLIHTITSGSRRSYSLNQRLPAMPLAYPLLSRDFGDLDFGLPMLSSREMVAPLRC